jgi:hypothetical protein
MTVHHLIQDPRNALGVLVQSPCPETERAKRWLAVQSRQLWVDLGAACRA